MLKLLLLLHFLISTVNLIKTDCADKKNKLFDRLTTTLNDDNNLNSTSAKNLSIQCWEFVECSKNESSINKTVNITSGSIEFSDQVCKLLELLSGPIGTCFDHIRENHNSFRLFNCNEKGLKTKKHEKCSTVFNTCSQDAIDDYCDSEVIKMLQENRKLLENFNCIGAMLYNPAEIIPEDTQNPKIAWTIITECSKNVSSINKTINITSGSMEFSDQVCKLLELLSGPIGTCFDHIRENHNSFRLFNCNEKGLKTKKHEKCSTVFNTCSQDAIDDYCDSEVIKMLQENRKLLENFNCIGAMLYNPAEIIPKDTQNPKIAMTITVGEPDLLTIAIYWLLRLLAVAFVVGLVYIRVKWRAKSSRYIWNS